MPIIAFIRTILILVAFALSTQFATAQTENPMDEIVKTATESGMQVIVINPDGEKDNTDGAPEEEQFHRSIMMETQERAIAFRTTLRSRVANAPQAMEELLYILNAQSPSGHYSDYFLIVAITLAYILLAEIIVNFGLIRPFVAPWYRRFLVDNPIGYTEKLPVLLLFALLSVGRLVLVILLSYGLGVAFSGEADDGTIRLTVGYIYLAYLSARSVVIIWRMILAPYQANYRVPFFESKDARKLFLWLSTIASISVVVVNFLAWIEELGLSYNINALISSFLTLIVVFLNIFMVLLNRRAISTAILNGQPAEDASIPALFAARAWAPLIITYFLIAWAEMTYRLIEALPLGQPLISGFYFILLVILVVYALVGYLIERFFRRQRIVQQWQDKASQERAKEAAASGLTPDSTDEDLTPEDLELPIHSYKLRTFEDLSRRVANILAIVAAFWAISRIWAIDISMMSNSAINRSYDIIAILFIGYVIYHFVRIWIDMKIKEEGGDEIEVAPGDEGGAGGASRLATLLPLFRNFLLVVIFVTFALIALTNLGINVSALFAGAGVVGLAIGFGAQALVRDIFSGAFFLFDDAFRKGEYIDIGTVKGTVEKISVRSFQLRHHLGPLHTVPFGEIQHLTNFSRDWVMMKLKLRVTYDTDVEQVRKLVKNLGQELLEDEVIGHQFLQPLKSQGVIEMQDSAMIIRVKFMTKPGDQWVLRKRVYAEIRELFAREGIKFAHKEVTVRLADDDTKNLTPRQKEAVGAAALSAVEEAEMAGAGDTGGDR